MDRAPFRLVALAVLTPLLGCAHALVPPPPSAGDPADAEPAPLVVTGSHLPQRADLSSGLPRTTSPVTVYSSKQLGATGDPSLAGALRRLQP
jgi:hypothetical protein